MTRILNFRYFTLAALAASGLALAQDQPQPTTPPDTVTGAELTTPDEEPSAPTTGMADTATPTSAEATTP